MASTNTTPSFQTLSRDQLRSLKATRDEKNRLDKIDKIIKNICDKVYERATFTKKTYLIKPIIETSDNYKFYKDNIIDILSGLESKFPDSSIEFKIITWGITGSCGWYWIRGDFPNSIKKKYYDKRQYYDTSKISKTQRKYIYVATSECILINW